MISDSGPFRVSQLFVDDDCGVKHGELKHPSPLKVKPLAPARCGLRVLVKSAVQLSPFEYRLWHNMKRSDQLPRSTSKKVVLHLQQLPGHMFLCPLLKTLPRSALRTHRTFLFSGLMFETIYTMQRIPLGLHYTTYSATLQLNHLLLRPTETPIFRNLFSVVYNSL